MLVGNSYGGAAVAYAAATDPAAVSALVLLDAFVRDLPQTAFQRLAIRALSPPWRPGAWVSYYKSLYKATPPADLPAYQGGPQASLREPGRYAATMAMMPAAQGSHAAVEARLGDVRAPTLVVMGSRDPDFPDPAAEAQRTARALRAAARVQVQMVEGAGHYPHAEQPEHIAAAITAFLRAEDHGARAGPRPGLDEAAVVYAAADLIDTEGMEALALARLAERLGVRPPSLYNHVASLEALRRGLALLGRRELTAHLARARRLARSGADGILALALAYRRFAGQRPGLHAAAQRAPVPDIAALTQASAELMDLRARRASPLWAAWRAGDPPECAPCAAWFMASSHWRPPGGLRPVR